MQPVLFRIPLPDWLPVHELPIRGYGAMLALGFLTAILVAAWRARREKENPDHIYNAGILALVGGVIGARLFDVIEYADTPRTDDLGQPYLMYHNWTLGFNLFDGLAPLGLVVGAVAGAALFLLRLLPGPQENKKLRRIAAAVWAIVGALVVGRGMYIQAVRAKLLAAGPDAPTTSWAGQADPYAGFIEALKITSGGLTVYGGLILAAALVVAYLLWLRYRHGVNPLKMADIIAPSVALGLAFGRMGCFLNGCCYGAPSNLPWAFAWPGPSPAMPEGSIPWQAGLHGPIHPAQLYGVANGLLMFLVLHLGYRWKPRHGVIIGAFFALKATSRILLEWLRLDEVNQGKVFFGGLTISQVVSLFVLAGLVIYFLWLWRSKMSRLDWKAAPALGHGQANRRKK